jgi:hypothetical protein
MGRYGLAGHVFVCLNDDHVVMLDLKQDRYFALEASRATALGALVRGWPVQPPPDVRDDEAASAGAAAAAQMLLRKGLLSDSDTTSKDATPVRATPPARELVTYGDHSGVPIHPSTVIAFLAAAIFAKFAFRLRAFEHVIRRVRQRRQTRGSNAQPLDIERARQLVVTFTRLRVFLFSSRDECLHDSLSLLEFLARHGVYPGWVFGVRARPFAAHCWVQHDGIVFNDTVEHVSGYTPIMVV